MAKNKINTARKSSERCEKNGCVIFFSFASECSDVTSIMQKREKKIYIFSFHYIKIYIGKKRFDNSNILLAFKKKLSSTKTPQLGMSDRLIYWKLNLCSEGLEATKVGLIFWPQSRFHANKKYGQCITAICMEYTLHSKDK